MRISILIVLALTATASEKNLHRSNPDAGFSFDAQIENIQARQLLRTIEDVASNIEKTLGKNSEKSLVRFFLNEESPKKNSLFRFFITYEELQNSEAVDLTFKIQHHLLQGYFNQKSIPTWLNAALIHNISFQNIEYYHLQKRFVFTRFSSNLGLKYNLNFLEKSNHFLAFPYMAKQAFIEKSKILERLIFRSKKLKNRLKADLSSGDYNAESIKKYLSSKSNFNSLPYDLWLDHEVHKIIYNSLYPIKGRTVISKLDDLYKLTVYKKNKLGQYTPQKLALEDLAEYKPSSNVNYLMTLLLNFSRLYNRSPFYLKNELIKIQEAIKEFSEGKKSSFKKKIVKVKNNLKSAVEIEDQRLQWFKSQEKKFRRSSQIYPEILNTYDNSIRRKSALLENELTWFNKIEAELTN